MSKRAAITFFLCSLFCAALYMTVRGVMVYRASLRVQYTAEAQAPEKGWWKIQSIDTMKQSRDLARGKLKDVTYNSVIAEQVRAIADTGANYVAIDTPYDKEFLPFLRRWVAAARANSLHVWFRGNWSGWEGWFDYPKNVSRTQHIQKTKDFIVQNPDIFQDGDIFSACPECENGGPGDPRQTGDVVGYRKFVIDEYNEQMRGFSVISKKVQVLYPSNRDVAKLIMDTETTKTLGGLVAIDHYIDDPKKMAGDIEDMARSSGGKVVLGEFGAPPLDVHGGMTENDQARWIHTVLEGLSRVERLAGVNYWINTGGPTELWKENGAALPSVASIKEYFIPNVLYGSVTDEFLCPISNAKVVAVNQEAVTTFNGSFEMRSIGDWISEISVAAPGFIDRKVQVGDSGSKLDIMLTRQHPGTALQKWWLYSNCLK